jgi:hypothetical protein
LETLYHLHPVFEFYLTAYFGFLVAPRFLSEFLSDRIDIGRSTESKELVLQSLRSLQTKINKIIKEFENLPANFKQHAAAKPIQRFIKSRFEPLYTNISNKITQVNEANAQQLRDEIVKSLKYTYTPIFVFTGLYCLIILFFNGWANLWINEYKMMPYFSVFNFICLAVSGFFLGRKRFFNSMVSNSRPLRGWKEIECHFLFPIFFIILIWGVSFYLIPQWGQGYLFSPPEYKSLIVISSLILGFAPLILYSLYLLFNSRRCYEAAYLTEVRKFENEFQTNVADYEKELILWRTNYAAMEDANKTSSTSK